MDMSITYIEYLTSERLRKLPVDEGVYSPEGIEHLEEDDELSPSEAWFMTGYLDF
jgi:hypothetical protein